MPGASLLLCLVVGVSDGDTLKVRCDPEAGQHAQILTIRLGEVDAPEKRQPFGARSRAHLASLCFKRPAEVLPTGRDRYGRTVARVACSGTDASAAQARAGMAWAFRKYLTDSAIQDLEAEARQARRGLWADTHPMAPWDWRAAQRTD